MRVLVDYRPALRQRTGVGEYMHELTRAYAKAYQDQVAVFTSSWKDRPSPDATRGLGVQVVDRRIPVRLLNVLWHRAEWPPVEWLAGDAEVVHAAHPLLIPARRAAQVVTVHDLFFVTHPETTRAEIRRDYAALAGAHARRAHAIVTPSLHTKDAAIELFGVPAEHIHVCPPGAPEWTALGSGPNVPEHGYVLFIGTLEPRKNVGLLLDAFELVVRRVARPPRLVIAGGSTPAAGPWLARLAAPPLSTHVDYVGYVDGTARERLYSGARAVVLPSLYEGFGLPALEAMSAGVPVIVSNRGALPEVVGDAGVIVDADDAAGWADAIEQVVSSPEWACQRARAGLARARAFTWELAAERLHDAYVDAIARRRR